jgi:adenosylhomocysteine nucleosidase
LTEPVSGVVCALRSEARCLGVRFTGANRLQSAGHGVLVALTGMGANAAAAGAERLVAAGAGALVSFGMAGGLDPTLPAGTLVLADEVSTSDGVIVLTDRAWCARLASVRGAARVVRGRLLSVAAPVVSVRAKAELYRTSSAIAIDMESAAIAEVARRRTVPFVVVRAIVDDAAAAVPTTVLASARADGEPALARLLRALLRHPADVPAVVRLGRGYFRAARSLRAVARSGSLVASHPRGDAAVHGVRLA